MINGSAYLKKPSSDYRVMENCGFIIFPGEAVNYNPNPSNPCEYFWCAIKGNDIQTIVKSLHLTRENPIFTSKLEKYDMRVLINNIFSSYMLKNTTFNQSLIDLLNSVQVKDDSNNSKSPTFEKALEYIHQNYEDELTISTISSKLSIDRTYLYKLFKKNLSISPQQYLIDHRISKALDLLATTNIAIGEIALTVGFSSFSDFSKQFKKRRHMSASQFRNTYCN